MVCYETETINHLHIIYFVPLTFLKVTDLYMAFSMLNQSQMSPPWVPLPCSVSTRRRQSGRTQISRSYFTFFPTVSNRSRGIRKLGNCLFNMPRIRNKTPGLEAEVIVFGSRWYSSKFFLYRTHSPYFFLHTLNTNTR